MKIYILVDNSVGAYFLDTVQLCETIS